LLAAITLVSVSDVDVENPDQDYGHCRVGRVHEKHEAETSECAEKGDVPLRAEGRPVARVGRKVVQEADETERTVGDHEEHGDDLRYAVQRTQHDEKRGQHHGNQACVVGFVVFSFALTDPVVDGRSGEYFISGDGLQRTGRNEDGTEGGTDRGGGQPQRDEPPTLPGDVGHHQAAGVGQCLRRGGNGKFPGHEKVDHHTADGGGQGAEWDAAAGVFEVAA